MTSRQTLRLMRVRSLAANGEARSLRQRARLSLADIGAACDVDQATVWRWEMGTRRPRGEPALKYARLLEELERSL
jgi:DNA-binding transcriptional regulator YiaG